MKYSSNLNVFRLLSIYGARVIEGVAHDVRQRYLGSVVGIGWAVLLPAMQLSIYAGLYAFVFKVRPSGLNEWGYILLVFSGLVPIMAFNEALTSSISSVSANKNLLLNTVFPAELIPLRSVVAAHFPHLFGLAITLCLGFVLGRTDWKAIVLVPVCWLLLLMFATGIGWILSLVSLIAKDIQQVIGLVLMVMMIISPFAYTPEMVPGVMKPLLLLNPLSYFVLTFQQLICYGNWPDPRIFGGAALIAITSFMVGYSFFQRAKGVFFDYA
ncbi:MULTISPECIES: ABC transporter permease [Bradyrhizobium]|jgi:homopolymeric O-antigen transport system permease protein|uniref:ABC transporter permease n=1 Tax=Bradyrhizobium TaxID=374 RepID=UPI0009B8B82E|nr:MULTISPECIES: ABC transporter permease [Bradyrhizobium]MCS3451021.1 lipopolysaccharide transport system permease protein [Bradyrhizobium elkanii]MCS3557833.1 lipopolysaccharide transport system permease protein [Bradyrhizobium elkanii]MCW2152320.1 lipopolysaccharide transport system permease protein [Bradyrhizobium elkanii]MCW2357804.1 lipopolysaccharide transport system permease protein [Bradyrhizobium elkanii]MCW2376050.1 lipopolysaccharide transport system permease protein [Bradyrhizobiu